MCFDDTMMDFFITKNKGRVILMKIGFIGVGNMAKAIIRGLILKGQDSKDILVHSARKKNYENFAKENNLTAIDSNKELVNYSDVIILAVQPITADDVLKEIKDTVSSEKLILSVMGGNTLDDIEKILGKDIPILRTLPNVNVEIGEGMTSVISNGILKSDPYNKGVELFDLIGRTVEVPEKDFVTFSAIAGSAPAYAYLFIDALSRAGVKHGLSKVDATKIAAQMVQGSAKMVLDADKVPYELIDQVSSPGGTTVAGLLAMEEYGLSTAVVKGIDATIAKDLEA